MKKSWVKSYWFSDWLFSSPSLIMNGWRNPRNFIIIPTVPIVHIPLWIFDTQAQVLQQGNWIITFEIILSIIVSPLFYFRYRIVLWELSIWRKRLKCPAHPDINVEVKGTLEQPCSRPTRSMLNPTFVSSQDGDEEQIKLCHHPQEQLVDNGQDDQDGISSFSS